jgi:hypothetical protein
MRQKHGGQRCNVFVHIGWHDDQVGPPPSIFAVLVVVGSAATLAMLGYVLAGLQYSAAAYITALTIDFLTVVFGYVIALDVIMQQPVEVPERPARR